MIAHVVCLLAVKTVGGRERERNTEREVVYYKGTTGIILSTCLSRYAPCRLQISIYL